MAVISNMNPQSGRSRATRVLRAAVFTGVLVTGLMSTRNADALLTDRGAESGARPPAPSHCEYKTVRDTSRRGRVREREVLRCIGDGPNNDSAVYFDRR